MIRRNLRRGLLAAGVVVVVVIAVAATGVMSSGRALPPSQATPFLRAVRPVITKKLESRLSFDPWVGVCTYRVIGDDRGTAESKVYLWRLCELDRVRHQKIQTLEAESIPTVVTLARTDGTWAVTHVREPLDPTYTADIQRLFPETLAGPIMANDPAIVPTDAMLAVARQHHFGD